MLLDMWSTKVISHKKDTVQVICLLNNSEEATKIMMNRMKRDE